MLLALTFSTGVIDAVGYLGLDRVFTGNMTGNVVILGMAVTGSGGLPVVGPLIALAGFGTGAAGAGRFLRSVAAGWGGRIGLAFSGVAVLLLAVAIALFLGGSNVRWVALTVTGVLGVAMGLQAGTARHLALKDVTTVVVTSTITALAAQSWLGSNDGRAAWRRRTAAITLIVAGAAAGAGLLHISAWLAVALSAATTAVVVLVGWRSARMTDRQDSLEEQVTLSGSSYLRWGWLRPPAMRSMRSR